MSEDWFVDIECVLGVLVEVQALKIWYGEYLI